MLSISNLTKFYKTKNSSEVKALDNVSTDFGDKRLVFLLGKSGSGKSTLLNLIGGLDKATSGDIVIDGRSSSTFSESDFDGYRNTYIGFVFQEYNLIDSYTVGANVALALELQGRTAGRCEVDAILRKVELVDDKGETLYDRHTNELSGGQKQRVAIARALIKNPRIILADEPTGALDSKTGEQLYQLLKSLASDKLIIVVSHDRENAEKYGNRIIELKDGAIISDNRCSGGSVFKATEKNVQNGITEDYKFIRSRLPFKRSFVMGATGLRHKKFRLMISIFLSVISFAIFGFSLTASAVDEYTAELKTIYANNQNMLAIESNTYDEQDKRIPFLTSKQLDEIKKYNNNVEPIVVSNSGSYQINFSQYIGEHNSYYSNNPYVQLGLSPCYQFAELDRNTGEESACLTPDARFLNKNLCKLPSDFSEIAITDLRADMFIKYGYKSGDGTITPISTPDELIGKTLGEFTISGVYSTEIDRTYFAQFDIDNYKIYDDNYLNFFCNGAKDSMISYNFVCKGFRNSQIEFTEADRVLLKLNGDFNKARTLIDKLNYGEGQQAYSVRLISAYSSFVSNASFFKDNMMLPAMITVIVFSVFAALLMMSFLTASIDFKKKELGILRALGARRKDVSLICLIESLIIACIDFVLSLITLFVLCAIFNAVYFISIFNVGFVEILWLFLLCFGAAALSTMLPVMRIAKKKPVDIISDK